MSTGKPAKQGPNALGAIMDLLILILLVGAAGGGGYYWGTIQRMAPVKLVAEGTPGAVPSDAAPTPGAKSTGNNAENSQKKSDDAQGNSSEKKNATGKEKAKHKDKVNGDVTKSDETAESDNQGKGNESAANGEDSASRSDSSLKGKKGAVKYWVASSGSDYIGYQITIFINGNPVDSFFGPGKTIDLTRFVKTGDNSIVFDAKSVANYNKHKEDASSVLTLQLVSGPHITQDDFKESDVLLTYKRNAAETEDFKDTKHFKKS